MTDKDRKVVLALFWVTLLLLSALALFSYAGPPTMLVVRVEGTVVYRAPLEEARGTMEFSGPVGKSVVQVDGARVRMLWSDCPDKICMNMGWIASPGQVIVCLPNRVVVSLERDAR